MNIIYLNKINNNCFYTYNIKFFNMVKKTDTKVFKMYNIQVH